MSATNIIIAIAAQTASAIRDIDQVNSALGRQMTASEKASGAIKKMAVPAAAAFAAVGAAAFGTVSAAEEAASVQQKLNKVYESMGYAELADEATAYADALSKQIGVDDEVIKGAQTKLATFSEVAKNADLMGQATSIAADLSAAGFGSMDSASVMLGKALQDPVKGMNAMARVGVTFDEQQKKQIKTMMAAGNTAGAQAIIMDALRQQVGGVAKESATSSARMKVAFGEVSESVGGAMLPAFNRLLPVIEKVTDWATRNPGLLLAVGGAIAAVAGGVLALNAAMAVWQAVGTAVSIVNGILGTSFTLALGPVLLVIAAIAAVIAVGVLLYKNWDEISDWLKRTWEGIKSKATELWGSLRDWFAQTWDAIKDKVTGAWDAVKGAVTDGIRDVVEFAKGLPGKVTRGIGDLASTLYGKGKDLIGGFVRGYLGVWDNVLDFADGIAGKVARAVGNVGSTLYGKGRDLIDGFIDGIRSMSGRIMEAILGILPKSVRTVIGGALGLGRSASLSVGVARSGGVATFNFYGTATSDDARAVKRYLEGYDISQGRAPGAALARAW